MGDVVVGIAVSVARVGARGARRSFPDRDAKGGVVEVLFPEDDVIGPSIGERIANVRVG